MKIVPLGTGGWIPNEFRQTACIVLVDNDHCIMFDVGTGISRLLELKLNTLLYKINKLDLILSHYHLDHVIGLTWLPKFWTKEITLYAPTTPWLDFSYQESLDRLTKPPLFALPLENFPGKVDVIPITDKVIQIGNHTIKVMPQKHPGGSLSFRLDDSFAYITDVDPDTEHAEFLKDVNFAFIDTMYDNELYKKASDNFSQKTDHGYSHGVAKICSKSNVKNLGLIHLNPGFGTNELSNLIKETKQDFQNAFIPSEGKSINV